MAEHFQFSGRCNRDRIAAGKGALAFNGSRHGQIVDCSQEGLCFQYEARGNEGSAILCHAWKEMAADTLDIFFGAHDFSLIDMPVFSLADYPVFTLHTNTAVRVIRYRHVTFGKLSLDQLSCLKRFLELGKFVGFAKSRSAGPARYACS